MDKFNDVAIKCPECDHSFEVSEEVITAGIRDKIETEIKSKYENEIEVIRFEKENMKKTFQNEVDDKVKLEIEKEKKTFLNKIQDPSK